MGDLSNPTFLIWHPGWVREGLVRWEVEGRGRTRRATGKLAGVGRLGAAGQLGWPAARITSRGAGCRPVISST